MAAASLSRPTNPVRGTGKLLGRVCACCLVAAAATHRVDFRACVSSSSTSATSACPESESRLSRCKSARISAALWYRNFRSFSSALLITSSSFGETSGFSRMGGTGLRFRIASVITAEVSPRKGRTPVAISYSTTPNENKSVRASSSPPRTCSGDM